MGTVTARPGHRSTIDVHAAAETVTSDPRHDRTLPAHQGASPSLSIPFAVIEPGSRVSRYRILGPLGAGGMGVVYRAYDPQLDREVALKFLQVGTDGLQARTRLLREAQAAAKIRHANVVTIYDVGEAFGRVFIAMELIDGVTLGAHVKAIRRGWHEIVAVMLAAGEGLCAAHRAGLVHRDFKPDNVLVEAGGRVRVLDFGLARPAMDTDPQGTPRTRADASIELPLLHTLTQAGTLLGTPAYMAPEQHLARAVDARTDQFAYCVAFFECLYQSRPFAGATMADLTINVLEGRLSRPLIGDTPVEIFKILSRGLAVEPAGRYPRMDDLMAELRAVVEKHESRNKRVRLLAVGLALSLLAGFIMYIVGFWRGVIEVRRPTPAIEATKEVMKQ